MMIKPELKQISEKLKASRPQGFSVTRIVDYVNLHGDLEGHFTEQDYYRLEEGRKRIPFDVLIALVELGVDFDYIFS